MTTQADLHAYWNDPVRAGHVSPKYTVTLRSVGGNGKAVSTVERHVSAKDERSARRAALAVEREVFGNRKPVVVVGIRYTEPVSGVAA